MDNNDKKVEELDNISKPNDEPKKNGKGLKIKKDHTINIGSKDGSPDRIFNLKEGESLPDEIEKKFLSGLKRAGIV